MNWVRWELTANSYVLTDRNQWDLGQASAAATLRTRIDLFIPQILKYQKVCNYGNGSLQYFYNKHNSHCFSIKRKLLQMAKHLGLHKQCRRVLYKESNATYLKLQMVLRDNISVWSRDVMRTQWKLKCITVTFLQSLKRYNLEIL